MTPEDLQTALARALATADAGLVTAEADAEVDLVAPTRRELGDWSTRVALRAAAEPGHRLALAEHLCAQLRALPEVASAEVAGPGFVNIRLTTAARARVAFDIVAAAEPEAEFAATAESAAGPENVAEPSLTATPQPQVGRPCAGSADGTTASVLQRGHAAACRERRRAAGAGITTDAAEASRLDHPSETRLLNTIASVPIASVPTGREPSHHLGDRDRLLSRLRELADAAEDWLDRCPVTPTIDVDITTLHASRLVLLRAVIIVLAAGLRQLGASAPERI